MKRLVIAFLIGLVVGLVVAVGVYKWQAGKASAASAEAALKYQTYRELAQRDREARESVIAALERKVAERDKAIAELSRSIGEKNAEIAKGREREAALEAQYPDMTNHPLVLYWKGQFLRSQEVVAEQGQIISSLQANLVDQKKITEQIRAMLLMSETGRQLADTQIAALSRENKWLRATGKVKTVLVLAAAGYLGYKILLEKD